MPYAKYFLARAKSKNVTGADVVDLISSSTRNVGHKNPPHPHAHIHKEGFIHADLTPHQQNQRRALAGDKKITVRAKGILAGLNQKAMANKEGLHLDPAKRAMMAPDRQLKDTGGDMYINRMKHSQFEDSEVAVLALVHSLNSEAGAAAMAWLDIPGKRVAITSLTAANLLNAGPVNLKHPAKATAHPLAGKVAKVIERGPGASGVAKNAVADIYSVVSVFNSNAKGEIVLVTHYPTQKAVAAPTQDSVQKLQWNTKIYVKVGAPTPFTTTVTPAAPVAIEWSHAAPGLAIARSATAGAACVKCAKVHGYWSSSRWNPWYRCQRCGDLYCPDDGDALAVPAAAAAAPNSRQCPRAGCNGLTEYAY